MICHLVRHGQDDDSVRGGWGDTSLTAEGISQVVRLGERFASLAGAPIGCIYTSDLRRARQTADILSEYLSIPVVELSEFRETNNGVLAGMKNDVADKQYPGLYWSTFEWDEHYPGGESPHDFFNRISKAWINFKSQVRNLNFDVILVTHGGVLNVIQSIENNVQYSNRVNPYPVANGEMVSLII